MNKDIINYSQCWEDPKILQDALRISKNDVVLSITSGGDNTLALLSRNPQKVISIDINRAQNNLLELKIAAIKSLDYLKFLNFMGVEDSIDRISLFTKCKPYLKSNTYRWWFQNQSLIKKGIIHAGKFEKFITRFRKYVLPFIHSKKTINEFIVVSSIQEQVKFYINRWDSRKWRLYFRLSSHPFILNRFGRQKEMSSQTTITKVAHKYLERLEKNLNNVLLSQNYFMQYCLIGTYGKVPPLYIEEKNYKKIKSFPTSSLIIETTDALNYLKSKPANTFSKYNLSDIFETFPQDNYETLWSEIIRTSKKNAVVAYWNNLVTRPVPHQLKAKLKEEKKLSAKLSRKDRVFFYEGFHIYTVLK